MITAPGAIGEISVTGPQFLQPSQKTTGVTESADAFSAMVGEAAAATIARLDRAESVSMDALKGEADTRDVVDAVMSAEQALQAAIAVRDKIVTAYLDISRMSI